MKVRWSKKLGGVLLAALLTVAAVAAAACWPLQAWEKLATRLVMPYSLAWIGATFWAVVAARRRQVDGARWAFCLAAILYVGGNGWLAKGLHWRLEGGLASVHPLEEGRLDAIVLLGGGATAGPGGRAQLGVSGDRVMMAARLYHAGVAQQIVCTGSRIEGLDRAGRDQAALAAELLVQVGVPRSAVREIGGRHTAEEMQILAEILPPGSRWGLITSAFHMPRALRLARRQGWDPVPLPVDFRVPADRRPTLLDAVPDAYAAYLISLHVKEWLAAAWGR